MPGGVGRAAKRGPAPDKFARCTVYLGAGRSWHGAHNKHHTAFTQAAHEGLTTRPTARPTCHAPPRNCCSSPEPMRRPGSAEAGPGAEAEAASR